MKPFHCYFGESWDKADAAKPVLGLLAARRENKPDAELDVTRKFPVARDRFKARRCSMMSRSAVDRRVEGVEGFRERNCALYRSLNTVFLNSENDHCGSLGCECRRNVRWWNSLVRRFV